MLEVGPRTRLLGLLGWPVAHSHSPALQQAGIAALGLDWVYGAFAVPPAALTAAIAGARALGFVGVNLTAPHKIEALRCCRADDLARRVGAVNTIVCDAVADDGLPRGLNTDVYGFTKLLEENAIEVAGRLVVLLGGGGAARAAAVALVDLRAEVVSLTRRGTGLGLGGGAEPHAVSWSGEALARHLPEAALLVDATSRPRHAPQTAEVVAREVALLSPRAAVVDLAVYQSTTLVEQARRRGLIAAAGEAMLLHQGARALEAWSGRAAPVEEMRRALRLSLGRSR